VIVNAITGRKTALSDYVPHWGEQPQQSPESIRSVLKQWGSQVNAHYRKNQG
jgi:hypothetical protein